MPGYVDAPADRVALRMTPVIRNMALEAGWPRRVAYRLSVTHSGGYLHASYDGDRQEMEDLEYGTASNPPKSVIGNFFGSHRIKKQIRSESQMSLVEISQRIDRLFS